MAKNKKILIIFGVLIIVIIIAIFIVHSLSLKQNKPPEPASYPLTEDQKIQILDQLSKGVDTSPTGQQKQADTLKKLNGGKTESQPLTDEQKQKILSSFNNL